MAAPISNVSFQSPAYDYGADLSEIERRRAFAQQLLQQSQQNEPTQTVGGFAVRQPMLSPLVKALQGGLAGYGQKQADEEQRALSAKAREDLADVLRRGSQAAAGSPGSPMPSAELGGGPAQPAQAPNMGAAAEAYMQHPMTAPMGMQMAQTAMQNQQRRQMLAGIMGGGNAAPQQQPQGPSAGTAAAVGAPWAQQATPQAMTQPQGPGRASPFAGMPPQVVALMTSGDPELVKLGTTLMEANKGIAQRPGAPVVNPITGAVIAQPTPSVPAGMQLNLGPGGPQAALVPGYAGAQSALHDIPKPDAPMVKLPMSGGQNIELTQPEYIDWQKTGRLPSRLFGGAPNAAPSGAPAAGAAPRPAGTQGLGVPGVSQSQQDIIRQQRETAAGKAVDEQFAKDYVQFTTGGAQDAAKQIAQLKDVQDSLAKGTQGLTGPMRGRLPDVVRSVTNPEAIAMRERVEEVVQRSLRAILGAQFTEREGERLIARAYNPALGEKENAIRVKRLTTQLEQAFKAKQDASQYFQKNNTLEGWKGKLPSIGDFDPAPTKGATDPQAVVDELRRRGVIK